MLRKLKSIWNIFFSYFRTITEVIDKTRKKYQSRIKYLEQQILQSLIQGGGDDENTARPLLTLPSDFETDKSDSD